MTLFLPVLQHERELYQQKMRDLEKKNKMCAAEMRHHKENGQQLEVEKEGMQEELEHGAAALKKWIEYAQVLRAALSKSKMAKGTLKKHLDILKGKTCIQVGTGIDLQSTATSLNDSNDVSHKELGLCIPVSPGLLGQSSLGCSRKPCLCAWLQPESIDCQIVSWHPHND